MKDLIKVDKPINLSQLDLELNGLGLVANINDALEVSSIGLADSNTATMDELQKCIDAHVAVFDEPNLEDKLKAMGINIDELKAALK
jgi:hypothetical protein